MKRQAVALALTTAMLASALAGCGRGGADISKDNNTGMTDTEGAVDNTGTESAMGTENGSSQLQLGNAVEIPESFDGQLAETSAHERLEQVITAYCNVPEEEYANVRYYYNYVDLNGDSEDEILALVLGQDVEGIKGNVLLWMDAESEDTSEGAVRQAFKQVGTPIYISSHMTGGYRDLIIPENTNLVMGTEGSGMDTVGGGTGNEAESNEDTTMTGVTGTDITEEGEGTPGTDTGNGGTGVGTSGAEAADTSEGTTGSDAQDGNGENGAGELDISLIPSEQQYRLLVWDGERYQLPEEGTALFSLEGYEGIAILTNNIQSDLVNDNYHFLGEAMR